MATKKATKKKRVGKKAPSKKSIKLNPLDEMRAVLEKDGIAEVLKMSDDDALFHVKDFLSTRSVALDKALCGKGVPFGRITEIAGDNYTGKSTILDQILAEAQSRGGYAVLVDTEHGHDVKYSRALGIDPDKLMVIQPKRRTLEGVFQSLSKALDVFEDKFPGMKRIAMGVDSVAGIPTEADLLAANEEGKQKPGDAAKTLHNMCRVLGSKVAQREIALIFTNQLYTALGGSFSYKKSYGGDALPYHASLRLKTKKASGETRIKDSKGRVVGQVCSVEIVKSRLWGIPSGSKVDIGLLHGVGVDNVWSIFETFKSQKYITSGGGWYSIHLQDESEPRKWQGGHLGLADICRADSAFLDKLVAIYKAVGAPQEVPHASV